jgi:putative spermidine/putrescine transport system ATP-binding protein
VISGEAARAILGSDATVAIRPEKIRLVRPGDAVTDGDVSVTGTVREIVYAGAETRVVVDAAGVTLSALLLNVATHAPDLHRGDAVTLCWERAVARTIEA